MQSSSTATNGLPKIGVRGRGYVEPNSVTRLTHLRVAEHRVFGLVKWVVLVTFGIIDVVHNDFSIRMCIVFCFGVEIRPVKNLKHED